MTSTYVDPRSTASAETTSTPMRQELSFTQRHAWLRQYEHAEQASHTATFSAPKDDQAKTVARQPQTALRAPPHELPPTREDRRTVASAPLTASNSERASAPVASHHASAITPTALWVQTPAVLCSPLAVNLPAIEHARSRRPAAAQTWAAQQVTVYRDAESLSLTLRDSQLSEADAHSVLRELNASGATRGLERIQITLNGRSLEQRARHPKE